MSLQNLRFAVLASFVAGMVVAFPGAALADAKIAVVDFQKVLDESKAGQGLQKQIMAQKQAFQDDLKKQDQALQATRDQLNKESDTAKSSGEFIQKEADLKKKFIDEQQAAQKKNEAMQKADSAAINEFRKRATEVIGDIVQKDKYSLVLNSTPAVGSVIVADQSLDITEAVVKQLDVKVTKIDIKPEAAAK